MFCQNLWHIPFLVVITSIILDPLKWDGNMGKKVINKSETAVTLWYWRGHGNGYSNVYPVCSEEILSQRGKPENFTRGLGMIPQNASGSTYIATEGMWCWLVLQRSRSISSLSPLPPQLAPNSASAILLIIHILAPGLNMELSPFLMFSFLFFKICKYLRPFPPFIAFFNSNLC